MGIMDKLTSEIMYYEFAMRHPQSIEVYLERVNNEIAEAQAKLRGLEKAKAEIIKDKG